MFSHTLITLNNMFKFLQQNFVQIGLGVSMIANLYLGYQRIQLGGYAIRKEIFEDYKERNEQLEDKIKLLGDKMNDLAIQINRLEATLAEKDKQIANLTKITDSYKDIRAFLGNLEILARESKAELLYQTDILDKQVVRDENIEEASSKHTGDPVRIETK